MSFRRLSTILVATLLAACAASAEPAKLRGYNAAIGDSSISGISSGAFMAVQFGTAWSSVITGVGVVAGGPYWCDLADSSDVMTAYVRPITRALGPCMQGKASDLDSNDFVGKADANAASGAIDATDNLKRQKIYLFHGYNDTIVARTSTDATAAFYRHYVGAANSANLFYQTVIGAGHSLVVQQQGQSDLNACTASETPFINQCGYDQAGIILQHIYGRLNPPQRGPLTGSVQRFDQSAYTGGDNPDSLGLGEAGYVFVPRDCDDGAACRVHIALHGCLQDAGHLGQRYIESTGYNAWAETNHLIVLYPQAKASSVAPFNPQACWDWWSYVDHSDRYVTKQGAQIKAIKAMLDALTAGAKPVAERTGAIASTPTVAVIDTSDTGADLAFDVVPGATYRVSRAGADGAFAVVGETISPSFAETGLKPQTTYRWHVAVVQNGIEGPASPDVTATTRATPPACDKPGKCPVTAAQ
jgi:poly(3-hydroxybutyrate) depolymerase